MTMIQLIHKSHKSYFNLTAIEMMLMMMLDRSTDQYSLLNSNQMLLSSNHRNVPSPKPLRDFEYLIHSFHFNVALTLVLTHISINTCPTTFGNA